MYRIILVLDVKEKSLSYRPEYKLILWSLIFHPPPCTIVERLEMVNNFWGNLDLPKNQPPFLPTLVTINVRCAIRNPLVVNINLFSYRLVFTYFVKKITINKLMMGWGRVLSRGALRTTKCFATLWTMSVAWVQPSPSPPPLLPRHPPLPRHPALQW